MGLTAIILTFNRAAIVGALLLAVATGAITFLFSRQRKHAIAVSAVMAAAWFFIALFAIRSYFGIPVGSVEVVSYERPE